MNMRQGIVVDTHPEGNAVDIVMADNGERLIGVKVLAGSGSSRTGGIDLPEIPPRQNKWDVSEVTEQDVWAAVGYVGRQPVITGFLFPPANQIGITDKATMYRRHQSDVQWSVDGDGNIQLQHPGGAYIRIGETPDAVPVETAQPSTVDRNVERKVNVRIGLADSAVMLTLNPDGHITITAQGNIGIAAVGNVDVSAEGDMSLTAGGTMTLAAAHIDIN